MAYFELQTAQDMLAKAHRERERLRERFNSDNVLNFFVTAYHICDYVCRTKPILEDVVKEFKEKNQDIKDCRDLCDKGKHFSLTQRPDPSTHIFEHRTGETPLGTLRLGGGRLTWVLHLNDRWVDVEQLADRVMAAWKSFFSENNL